MSVTYFGHLTLDEYLVMVTLLPLFPRSITAQRKLFLHNFYYFLYILLLSN